MMAGCLRAAMTSRKWRARDFRRVLQSDRSERHRVDRKMSPRHSRGQWARRRPARHCERSEAIQKPQRKSWIASSQELLAMTELALQIQAKSARRSWLVTPR